jgi:soluble lytic murein transglycosylase-like protein
VSFLNGVSGLGSGLGAMASAAINDQIDQAARASFLNRTPSASAESTPVAAAPKDDVVPIAASPKGANVPPDLLPIYQDVSKRTGIPVDILLAQGKQESNFNPNAIGSAGEIGLHQIKPATARDPGYGLAGIDPATLKDPAVNINFAADYLKAKAGGKVDWTDPKQVAAALAAYNGGGDPRYVQNVSRYMGNA